MSFSHYRDSSSNNNDKASLEASDEESFNIDESKIETNENDSNDEIINIRKINAKHQRRRIIDDSDVDSDVEEQRFENKALSPCTRRSIGIFRPSTLSSTTSDSSSICSDDTDNGNKSESDNEKCEATDHINDPTTLKNESLVSEESDDNDVNSSSENFIPEGSQINKEKYVLSNESKSMDKIESSENSNDDISTCNSIEKIQKSVAKIDRRQSSFNFNMSIRKKHSSTLFENDLLLTKDEICKEKGEKSSDLVKFNETGNEIIVLDSSEEENKFVQPKITTAFGHASNSTPKRQNLPVTALQRTKLVSEEFFNEELKKLQELKNELAMCENLFKKVGFNLPDKGERMSERIYDLKEGIKKQADFISILVINKDSKQIASTSTKPPSWEELSAATNAVLPKHTGKIGLATFTAQKTVTVECLKDIYGSLKTCPGEDVLAEQPKNVKTRLMEHQRHALAWMIWREKQKPPGGILADDMGLGKTLTMISLVLASIECESISDTDNNTSDDDNNYYYGGTLVVGSATIIHQWEKEVKKHTARDSLSICVHHGINREEKSRRLAKYDMVITTYDILKKEARGLLGRIKWERIILDEAHMIRNYKTSRSIAACELRAKSRWALTGTPIQNRELDLYAIIKFLGCKPFDDLVHWKKWIDNKSAGGQQRLNTLMKSLMLRRTKIQLQQNGTLKNLPTKEMETIEVELDKNEMNVYQKILIYSQTLFAQFLIQRQYKNDDPFALSKNNQKTLKLSKEQNQHFVKMYKKLFPRLHGQNQEVKSHEILVLLLRLRQICCHPGLIDSMLNEENLDHTNDSDSTNNEIDLLQQLEKLQINDDEDSNSSSTRDENSLTKATSKLLLRSNPVFNLNRPSSKMKKILQCINDKLLNTNDKAIIVSQWVSFLNIIKSQLILQGIQVTSLDGSVPVSKRNNIVNTFNDSNSNIKVMLLSLTTGGVGLNLVGANHLFLIDLHWNPQLEAQASDRIYRIGQNKPVYIYKFFCKNTIEERIKLLQEHKLSIANEVLTGVKRDSGSKLSMEDLKNLFGL